MPAAGCGGRAMDTGQDTSTLFHQPHGGAGGGGGHGGRSGGLSAHCKHQVRDEGRGGADTDEVGARWGREETKEAEEVRVQVWVLAAPASLSQEGVSKTGWETARPLPPFSLENPKGGFLG